MKKKEALAVLEDSLPYQSAANRENREKLRRKPKKYAGKLN